jgi:gamma-glutamyltranspeptidase / glutathione hydrolase
MVSTANEHASAAAAEILEAGGSAADAAIAAQLVLGLVEPQSSGIGGGAFALHWDAGEEALTAWDGRETAPVAAPGDLFSDIDSAATFHAAATGGRAVGVPGIVSLLWELHRAEGELAWEDLFGPALRLAEEGFAVSPRLHGAIADAEGLDDDPWRASSISATASRWPSATCSGTRLCQHLEAHPDHGAGGVLRRRDGRGDRCRGERARRPTRG